MAPPRPWRLEAFQDGEWRLWSTYVEQRHAEERRDLLKRKGYRAQVVTVCSHCSEEHPAPFDGRCLL